MIVQSRRPSPAQAIKLSAHAHRLALVGVFLLGFTLRVHDLGANSLWNDELIGLDLASYPLGEVLQILPSFGGNNATYYLLLHFWVGLLGPTLSEELARLPSVVFGLAAIGAIYALGAELFNRRVGLAASFLTAVNPYHIGWSQAARGYTLWALLITLSYLGLVRSTREESRLSARLSYAMWMLLAFFTHLFTALVVLAQIAAVFLPAWRRSARAYAWALLPISVLVAPLVVWVIASGFGSVQLQHVRYSSWMDVPALLTEFAGGVPLLVVHAALIGWAVVSYGRRSAGSPLALLLCWVLLPVFVVLALSLVFRPMLVSRYLFAIHPGLCLLAGLGMVRLRPAMATVGVGLLTLVLAGHALASGFTPHGQLPDWRGAVAHAVERAQPGDGWIVVTGKGLAWRAYVLRSGIEPATLDVLGGTEEVDDETDLPLTRGELDQFAATHPRIWLIRTRGAGWVPDRLKRMGYAAREWTFAGVTVVLFRRS